MSSSKSNCRIRVKMDADWKFQKGDLPFSAPRYSITKWQFKLAGTKKPADGPSVLKALMARKSGWKPAKIRQDVFNQKKGFAWFKTDLPDIPGPGRLIHFTSVGDDCTVYLNGKKLLFHERWIDPFDVPLDSAWKPGGPNQLVLLVENQWLFGFVAEADLETATSFTTGPALETYDDSSWRKVHLPHDFVVEGKFKESMDGSHGFLSGGVGWYRKSFDVPASDKGKSLWIDFEGIFRNSRIWLNGRLLGRHKSGYTPVRYDITELVRYGDKNLLSVRVDSRGAEGWWYEGGGIYRPVWLNKADLLHVAPWGVYVVSKPVGCGADITIETTIASQAPWANSGRLVSEVIDPKGKTVLKLSSPVSVLWDAEKTFTQKGRIAQAQLWDLEHPLLYKVRTRLEKNGKTTDEVKTTFGIRTLRFDKDKGFFLNGKHVEIQGTCNHQDHAGLGVALPERLFNYRIGKLKSMGSNAYRCAHHPHAEGILDACDQMGMLVMDENRRLGDTPDILEQVKTMVLRDRNHPSVFLWSICNEEPMQDKPEGRKRARAMRKVILKYDRTRPITAAINYGFKGGIQSVLDLEGLNYNIHQYEDFRKKYPNVCMLGSETASTLCSRGEYETDPAKGYVSAYDVNHTRWSLPAEDAWRPVAERPFIAGVFVWTGFDYRGEPTPYSWPCINSHFGILDVCGFPKDNFFYYKAWWGNEPLLHVFPHWNWKGKEEKEIEVWCHSNCDRVRLFLNGEELGTKEVPKWGHLSFKVKYQPGTLLAMGWKNGKVVVETKVETTGEPASIKLRPYQTKMKADGEDTMPIEVSILDAKGRLVPTTSNQVSFEVSGPGEIAGVGNGNPSSHEPDKAKKRMAFHGLCAAFVRAGEKPGTIRLTARSQGLKSASVTLRSI